MQLKHSGEAQIRKGEELLQTVLGVRLTSVQFIMDYLILGFDAKGYLNTYVWPRLTINGAQLIFRDVGYRDCLCSLITARVQNLEISAEEEIKIEFENGINLDIPLRTYTLPGERAMFTAPKNQLFVW